MTSFLLVRAHHTLHDLIKPLLSCWWNLAVLIMLVLRWRSAILAWFGLASSYWIVVVFDTSVQFHNGGLLLQVSCLLHRNLALLSGRDWFLLWRGVSIIDVFKSLKTSKRWGKIFGFQVRNWLLGWLSFYWRLIWLLLLVWKVSWQPSSKHVTDGVLVIEYQDRLVYWSSF